MKCILPTVLLTMSCLSASSRASAQVAAQAKVPFEFTVGQSVLPAGEYSIKEISPSMIEIDNLEKGVTLYFVTSPPTMSAGSPTCFCLASIVTSTLYESERRRWRI